MVNRMSFSCETKPIHHESFQNQLVVGEDRVKEHLSLCLVAVENSQRVWLKDHFWSWVGGPRNLDPALESERQGQGQAADFGCSAIAGGALKKRYVVPRRTEGGQGHASGVAESYYTQVMSGGTE
jgi:hypothetical protein